MPNVVADSEYMKLIDGQKNGVIYCSVIFPKFLNKTLKLQHPLIFRGFLFGHFVQLTLKNATSCSTTTAHITCFFGTFFIVLRLHKTNQTITLFR